MQPGGLFSSLIDLYTMRGNSDKQRSLACKGIICTLKPDLSLSGEVQMDFLAVSMGRSQTEATLKLH